MASHSLSPASSYFDEYSLPTLTSGVGREDGLDAKSSKDPVVAPRKLLLKRAGCFNWNINIYDLGSPDSESKQEQALIVDKSPRFLPWRSGTRSEEEVTTELPEYFVHYVRGTATLYEGPGPKVSDIASKKVMEIKGEGCFNTTSTYTEANGSGRSTQMLKAKGPGGDPWWSVGRTLKDFDGQTYKWKNSWSDDLTCIRSDGVVVARFYLDKCSWRKVGVLEIEEVPKSLFDLVVSSHFIKWKKDNERRQRRRSGG